MHCRCHHLFLEGSERIPTLLNCNATKHKWGISKILGVGFLTHEHFKIGTLFHEILTMPDRIRAIGLGLLRPIQREP